MKTVKCRKCEEVIFKYDTREHVDSVSFICSEKCKENTRDNWQLFVPLEKCIVCKSGLVAFFYAVEGYFNELKEFTNKQYFCSDNCYKIYKLIE